MAKFSNYTAIIFRRLKSKEADEVVYALTEKGEKLVFFAKGVRKPQSRKAHAIDLLNMAKLKLVQGKGNLPTLTEASLITDFGKFKKDYEGIMFTQLVCELITNFAEEGQEDSGIYANIYNLLVAANPERYKLLAATIILRLLYNSGTLPKLNEDVNTGQPLTPEQERYLAFPIGYTTQPSATLKQEPISDRLYKVQRFIINQDFRAIQSIKLSPEEDEEIFNLHVEWIQNTTEKELKTQLFTPLHSNP